MYKVQDVSSQHPISSLKEKPYFKNIKSEVFREYSHLQGHVTSKKLFYKTLYYNQSKKGVKTYYITKLRGV